MSLFAHRTSRRLGLLAFAAVLAATPAAGAPYLGPEHEEPVRLNASPTVAGADIKLGDLFTGEIANKDKVVGKAPRPGQRATLTAEFLSNVARTNNIDWRPADTFDRAVVYRPAQTLNPADILVAIKTDLVQKGMPEKLGLRPANTVATLIVPVDNATPMTIREALFDSANRTFSAVVEVPGTDGSPAFMTVRGTTFGTMTVPVLKEDAARATIITAAMITEADLPEEQMKRDIITDAGMLIGKSPKAVVRAGRAIRDSDVARVSFAEVPVLKGEMRRDSIIGPSNIGWMTVNASDLNDDIVTTPEYLIGKSPRYIVAGGAPIRRGDVIATNEAKMAVAARDLPLGAVLRAGDVNWVNITDNAAASGAIIDATRIDGRATRRPIRAGQPLRTVDISRPTLVTRGKLVTILYATSTMKLTVQGEAMEDGGVTEVIRVNNAKSKNTVLAEVIDATTVRVVSQQSAMR